MTAPVVAPLHPVGSETALMADLVVMSHHAIEILSSVSEKDLERPSSRLLFSTVAALAQAGELQGEESVRAELQRTNRWEAIGGDEAWLTLMARAYGGWKVHARIVRHAAAGRRAGLAMDEALGRLAAPGAEIPAVLEEVRIVLAESLDSAGPTVGIELPNLDTIDDIPRTPAGQWAIPGLLRRNWRVLLVGEEGVAKSMTLRAMAICASQGRHPFAITPIEPVRALVVDLENPRSVVGETSAKMREQIKTAVGGDYDGGRCHFALHGGGLDLRSRGGQATLRSEIAQHEPGLVVLGPLYKTYGARRRGESDEDAAAEVQSFLDDLRTRWEFGLVMEHHAPKKTGAKRDLAPFGSSLWMRWPEIGLTISPAKDKEGNLDRRRLKVGRFRWDRTSEHAWPNELHWGASWPWEGKWNDGMPGTDPTLDEGF